MPRFHRVKVLCVDSRRLSGRLSVGLPDAESRTEERKLKIGRKAAYYTCDLIYRSKGQALAGAYCDGRTTGRTPYFCCTV